MGRSSEPLLDNNGEQLDDHEDEGEPVGFIKEFGIESKKLWKIAGPAILTSVFQYSLGAITQIFAGHLGDVELAAVSIGNFVIGGLSFGIMLGMGSALETLCGQAFGAGRIRMLGIYMQRSWVILLTTATLLLPIYVFSSPILHLLGQTTQISKAAGKYTIWTLPQPYILALNFPIQKFLQAQSKLFVMTWVSGVVMVLHIFLSWLVIFKLHCGLIGTAIALDVSWFLVVLGQWLYIIITKSDGAWSGFSWMAFQDLWDFLKLSVASAVMLCLEFWSLMVLIVIVGLLPNPLVPVDALSICMNIEGGIAMVYLGFTAAASVRVSNELGAGNARLAKFSVVVVTLTSFLIGILFMVIILVTRDYFPYLFTTSDAVVKETRKLSYLLAFTAIVDSVQPVLSGVAVGAGWQSIFAYINLGCYYIIGIPAGILLGFTAHLREMGVWGGMVGGICLQTLILIVITSLTNWQKEANQAESRIEQWGGRIANRCEEESAQNEEFRI